MGWQFRKIFSFGFLRLNLSGRGVGWSWGIPGLRYGISASGRRYVTFGFPGLGLYWMKYLDRRTDDSDISELPEPDPSENVTGSLGAPAMAFS
jgi:hypothetical protein